VPVFATLLTLAGGAAAMLGVPQEAVIGAYSTSLQGRTVSQRHNAHLSLGRLVGATIAPGATFSFNRRVGTFSRDQGFRKAPVSYNGQLIDDWGGGVCQTSTTLYNAALLAGMEIVERNHHRFAPSYVPPGRDAAVAFSGVDLRFRNPYAFPARIVGQVQGDRLQISLVGPHAPSPRPEVVSQVTDVHAPETYVLGGNGRRRVRNTGKAGFEVSVVRIVGNRREVVSRDAYPAMNRVVQAAP
jgi:vancomycin resistance protein YoaR